ncbi:MAG TPA: glycosyltransferase [Stellaceae bacterium]|nr:glycosyltransferase [Stellaceae bacterium]
MISVLQASAWYPPSHLGGTEVYLSGLVRELRVLGISSRIIAPFGPNEPDEYEFDGTKVRTFPINTYPSRAELRGEIPDAEIERFRHLLAEEKVDIYHQHSWTRGLGAAHLSVAREAGFKTVLTVHTPNYLCLRGTMMRFGQDACDGRIDPRVCGACWSQGHGAPRFIARSLGALSPALSSAMGRLPMGRAATAFSARARGELRKQEVARTMADADRIVAVCRWLFEALVSNGVPTEKLVLIRQGVDCEFVDQAIHAASGRAEASDGPFRLLYIGRWHPVKGVHVLVRAVSGIPPDIPVALSVHGVGKGAEELAYAAHIRSLTADDRRITILPPLPRETLARQLAEADALVVPSLWLETGPLVVLEAKAAGLPIIGSRLGGIAELVEEPREGLLVPPGDVAAWTNAITAMATTHARRPRTGPVKVRTMRDAANEMAALYSALCCADAHTL